MDMDRYLFGRHGQKTWGNRPLPDKHEHNHVVKIRELQLGGGIRVRRVIHVQGCPFLGWIVDDRNNGTRVRMSGWCTCDPTIVLSDGTQC